MKFLGEKKAWTWGGLVKVGVLLKIAPGRLRRLSLLPSLNVIAIRQMEDTGGGGGEGLNNSTN